MANRQEPKEKTQAERIKESGLLLTHSEVKQQFPGVAAQALYWKLLQPGWGGEITVEDARFIAYHLERSVKLRRLWRFRQRKNYPPTLIAERAFPEDKPAARRLMLNKLAVESATKNRRNREKTVSRVSDKKIPAPKTPSTPPRKISEPSAPYRVGQLAMALG